METRKPRPFTLRGGNFSNNESMEQKYGHLLKPITEEEFSQKIMSKEPKALRSRIITLECNDEGSLYYNISRDPTPAGWRVVADCEHYQAQRFGHVIYSLKNNYGIKFTPELIRELWMLLDEYHKRMSGVSFVE